MVEIGGFPGSTGRLRKEKGGRFGRSCQYYFGYVLRDGVLVETLMLLDFFMKNP